MTRMQSLRVLMLTGVAMLGAFSGMVSGQTPTPTCPPSGWTAGPNVPPAGLVRAVGIWFPTNAKFYSIGGRTAEVAGSDTTNPFEYDPVTNAWVTKAAVYPDNQVNNMACAVLTVGGTPQIYCVGGSAANGNTATSRVFIYNPMTDTVTTLPAGDNWPGNAAGNILPGGMAVVGNKMYVIGGYQITTTMTHQTWQFDPTAALGSKWVQRADLPADLGYIPAVAIGTNIFTTGGAGYDGNALFDTSSVFKYDTVANSWMALADLPRATGETRAVSLGGEVWVLGGGRTAPNPSSEVNIYNPSSNTWRLGPGFGVPRRNFPADSDGSRIWLAGGYAPTVAINTMEIYSSGCPLPTPTPSPTPTISPGITPTTPSPVPTPTPGPCRPVYFQDTFRRVYRQNQMFLEGVADITGDGKPDAYGYEHHLDNSFQNIVILPNDNAGGFGDPIVVNTTLPIDNSRAGYLYYQNHYYGALTVGDLNNDGRKDFVVRAATSPAAFFTMQQNSNGSFSQSAPTFVLTGEQVVDIADFDGDGRGDLLTTLLTDFYYPQNLYYRLGNQDGTFGAPVQLRSSEETAVIGNFAGDSKPDIAVSYSSSQHYVLVVYTNLGGGLFSQSQPVTVDMGLAGVADLNGDGFLDIYGDGVLLGNGSGTFTKVNLPLSPLPDFTTGFLYAWPAHYLADFDGDGRKDVLETISGQVNSGSIRKDFANAFWNDGTGHFTKTIIRQPFLGIPADMNGDGKDEEVIFVNSTNGTPRPTLTGETVVIVRSGVCTIPAPSPRTKIVDFGGDGISDIALFRGSSNGQWEYHSNLYEQTFNWGVNGDIPVTGDFDGDGRSDAAVFRPSTGTWWIPRSSNGTVFSLNFGLSTDIPIPADYDGDGISDIAVFRPSEGNWYFWFMGTQTFLGVHWGLNGDRPVPNDYDGDGKADIAVFRPSEGNWYYLRSSDGDFRAINFGLSSDIPVPADFDMDGKADVTVFRPGSGTWYTYRSFDAGVSVCHFGQNGDIPMAVDSDGDRIMEPAVYRTGQGGGWYAGSQPAYIWGVYVTGTPVRVLLPNN